MYDPVLIKEKVSRAAFEAQIEVTAILPPGGKAERARELLAPVAAAYRHYDHPAGARFRVGKARPVPATPSLEPAPPGLFGRRVKP